MARTFQKMTLQERDLEQKANALLGIRRKRIVRPVVNVEIGTTVLADHTVKERTANAVWENARNEYH